VRERFGCADFGSAISCGLGLGCRGHIDQTSCSGDVVSARAAGEQALVPDAVEAVRQDVDQAAADELGDGERHDLAAIVILGAVVLPLS
jgi:hypothetical protein